MIPDENNSGSPVTEKEPWRSNGLLVRELIQTREMRGLLGFLIPEILGLWAGDSSFKQKLCVPLSASICKSICQSKNGARVASLQNPADLKRIGAHIPHLYSEVKNGLDVMFSVVEQLDSEEKENLLSALLAAPSSRSGSGLTGRAAKMLHELHAHNPRLLTEALTPVIRSWYEATDFGELRDLLDGSATDLSGFVEMLNDLLWQYPAKLVLLLSFLPDAVNFFILFLKESIGRFNRVSPDLVADIVLSLFKEIDATQMGQFLNEMVELIRKLHTGSALIGEPGLPRFPSDVKKALGQAVAEVDPETLSKAALALAEDREAIANSKTHMLNANPAIWKKQFEIYGALQNTRIRSLRHQLDVLEENPDDDLVDALAEGISEIDTQEVAEIMNQASVLINRIRDAKPQIVIGLAEQLANAMDLEEVNDAAEWVLENMADSLLPVGRAFLPPLIQAACRMMAPADDEFEGKMSSAREQLRAVLIGEEATP